MGKEDGFTLIEALVALSVLAVSGIALLGAAEDHVRRIADLENRAVAQWVAENAMAELSIAADAPADGRDTTTMLATDWSISQAVTPTDDPDLARVEIVVSSGSDGIAYARHVGFVDTGAMK